MNLLYRFGGRWEKPTAVLLALVGLALLIGGWVGVSGQGLVTAQLPYVVSGAIGALFALAVAATLWLSADLRDEFAMLDAIHRELETSSRPGQENHEDGLDPAASEPDTSEIVAVASKTSRSNRGAAAPAPKAPKASSRPRTAR